jgi:hypothetical protein
MTAQQVFIVQISVSVVFLFWLGTREHMRDADYASPEGMIEMILFLAFLEKNTTTLVQLDWLTPSERMGERRRKYLQKLREQYTRLVEEGKLVPTPGIERISIWEEFFSALLMTLLLFPLAPLLAFGMEWGEDDDEGSITRLVHPHQRAHHLIQVIGILIPMAVWIAATTLLPTGTVRGVATAVLIAGFLRLLYISVKVIEWQDQWRKYWTAEFSIMMQAATQRNDHDLFNRAFNLHSTVERYPVFPLTAIQRTIVVVFALVQFILAQSA